MVQRIRGGRGQLTESNAITGMYRELTTLTCAHCNRVVVLNPERTRERSHCWRCNAYVCDSVGCNAECNPIQESVELALHYAGTPEGNQPWLLRGPQGEILFNPELRDRRRVH